MLPIRSTLILTLLVAASGAAAADQFAEDAESEWELRTFRNPQEVAAIFHSNRYGLAYWNAGDHSVPRIYVAWVPERWRKLYAKTASTFDKKRFFIFVFGPMVLRANEMILEKRQHLESLLTQPIRSAADNQWLADLAADFKVAAQGFDEDEAPVNVRELLLRVDAVPPSLVLAQAATESGWGTSRFTDEGNALFGQWTWSKDALVPRDARAELGHYGIRAFRSPMASICAYMENLNTHSRYSGFRAARAAARAQGRTATGFDLAGALVGYSERGADYVRELRALMVRNRLSEADEATLRPMRPIMLIPTGELSR